MKSKITLKNILKVVVILILISAFLSVNFVYKNEISQFLFDAHEYNSGTEMYSESIYDTYSEEIEVIKVAEIGRVNETISNRNLKKYYNTDLYTEFGYEVYKIEQTLKKYNTLYISNLEQIKAFAYYVNVLGNNCEGKTITLLNDINIGKASNWDPIGTETVNFKGIFNGKYSTVIFSELDSGDYRKCLGIFGYIGENGKVKDVVVQVNNFTATTTITDYFGFIAGYNKGEIYNCYINNLSIDKVISYLNTYKIAVEAQGVYAGYNSGTIQIADKNLYNIEPVLVTKFCGINKNGKVNKFTSKDENAYTDSDYSTVYNRLFIAIKKNGSQNMTNVLNYRGELVVNDGEEIEVQVVMDHFLGYHAGSNVVYFGKTSIEDKNKEKLEKMPKLTLEVNGECFDKVLPASLYVYDTGINAVNAGKTRITYKYKLDSNKLNKSENVKLKLDFTKNCNDKDMKFYRKAVNGDNELTGSYYFLKNSTLKLNMAPSVTYNCYSYENGVLKQVNEPTNFNTGDEIIIKATSTEPIRGLNSNPILIGKFNITQLEREAKLIDTSIDGDGKITYTYSYIVAPNDHGNMLVQNAKVDIYDLDGAKTIIGEEAKKMENVIACTTPEVTVKAQKLETGKVTDIINNTTNAEKIKYIITFNEIVYGFDKSDINITNGELGTLSSIIDNGNGTYSYTIESNVNVENGETIFTIKAGACEDVGGNVNQESITRITIDNTLPYMTSLEVVATEGKIYGENEEFIIKATFSENIDKTNQAPNLQLVFNNNNAKGSIASTDILEKTITWTYKVGKGDYGSLTGVKVIGEVIDLSGNVEQINEEVSELENNFSVDAEGPVLNNIQITSPEEGAYIAGQEIEIQAHFNQNLKSDCVAPNLKLMIGENTLRTVTNGVINEDTIIWKYIIQDGDNGNIILGEELDVSGLIDNQGYSCVKLDRYNLEGYAIVADTIEPIVDKIDVGKKENIVSIVVNFSEPIEGSASLSFKFGSGDMKTISLSEEDRNTSTLIGEYEVVFGEDNGNLIIESIDVSGLRGIYGNDIDENDDVKDDDIKISKTYELCVDTLAPTILVDSITVGSTEDTINISAKFDDLVKGKATVYFTLGEGEEKSIQAGSVDEYYETITWVYTLQEGDSGENIIINRVESDNLVDDAENHFNGQEISKTYEVSVDKVAPQLVYSDRLEVKVSDFDVNDRNIYKAGTKLIITTVFDEIVEGNAKLNLKFGNITRTIEKTEIKGKEIVWEYTIQNEDNGNFKTESLDVSQLKDICGNSFEENEVNISNTYEEIIADTIIPTLSEEDSVIVEVFGEKLDEDSEEKFLNEGQEISIQTTFSEIVTGTASLKLKFGEDGKTRKITVNEVDDNQIIWNYNIKSGDNGILIIEGIEVEKTLKDGSSKSTLVDYAGNGFETEDNAIALNQSYPVVIADTITPEIQSITVQKLDGEDLIDIVGNITNADKIRYTIIASEKIQNIQDNISLENAELENLYPEIDNGNGTYTYNLDVIVYADTENNQSIVLQVNEGYKDNADNYGKNVKKHEITIDKVLPKFNEFEIEQEGVQKFNDIITIVGRLNEKVTFEKDEDENDIIPDLNIKIVEYEDEENQKSVTLAATKVENVGDITEITWQYIVEAGDRGRINISGIEKDVKVIDVVGNQKDNFTEVKERNFEFKCNDTFKVDAIGPELTDIYIEEFGQVKGHTITIVANFKDKITGEAEPIIKFGGESAKGEIRQVNIIENSIIWRYTIEEGDNGELSITAIKANNLKDQYGNACSEDIEVLNEFEEVVVDTKCPELVELEILEPSSGIYPKDTEIEIKGKFDEEVVGVAYPNLEFGGCSVNKDNISVEINGNEIIWKYVIQEGDNGDLAINGIYAGNLTDILGNPFAGVNGYLLESNGIIADTTQLSANITADKVEIINKEEVLTQIDNVTNADIIRYTITFNKEVVDFSENSIWYDGGTQYSSLSEVEYKEGVGYSYYIDIKLNEEASEINFMLNNEYCKDSAGNTIENEVVKTITIDRMGPELMEIIAKDSIGFTPDRYKAGDKIIIEATFNEDIGEFNPIENIKLSFSKSGELKGELSDAKISGNKISWDYEITEGDEGILTVVRNRIGTVSDLIGNIGPFQVDEINFDNIVADTILFGVTIVPYKIVGYEKEDEGEDYKVDENGQYIPTELVEILNDKTNADYIRYMMTFNEEVSKFDNESIYLIGGTLVNPLTEIKYDRINKNWTCYFDVETGNSESIIYEILNEYCIDSEGNSIEGEIKRTISIDKVLPTLEVTSNVENVTNVTNIIYTFEFSEDVINFTADDIIVENGTKGAFEVVTNKTYTLEVINSGDCTQKVKVTEGVCSDEWGNNNEASNECTVVIDKKSPILEIKSNTTTQTQENDIIYTFEFNEEVKDFDINDIIVENKMTINGEEITQTVTNGEFKVISNKKFTLKVSNSENCIQKVSVSDGVCTDIAGNLNEAASMEVQIYRPFEFTIEGNATEWTKENITLTVKSDKEIILITVNGETIDGDSYVVTENGEYVFAVKDKFGDITTKKIIVDKIDKTDPTLEITANKISPTNAEEIIYTFKFSEDVIDFTIEDIIVENGTKGIFTVLSNKEYTLAVTNNGSCVQNVKVDKNVYSDIAGNINNNSESITITIDRTLEFTVAGNITEWTKENIILIVECEEELASIKVNGETIQEKMYVVTENGDYEFVVVDKIGNIASKVIKVDKIDKLAPVITGVENDKLYTQAVTPIIEDENLDTIKLLKNEVEVVGYTLGTPIIESGKYILIAKDKLQNETKVIFEINISEVIVSNSNQIRVTEDELVEEETKSVIRISVPKTTVGQLKEQLISKMAFEIFNANGEVVENDKKVGTGHQIKMESGKIYTIIVYGDITGDGEISISELAVASRIASNPGTKIDSLKFMAMDVSRDGKIMVADLAALSRLRNTY